jgi:hypothetical protein
MDAPGTVDEEHCGDHDILFGGGPFELDRVRPRTTP